MERFCIYALIVWNVIVFAMYGVDKNRAIHGKWRISEFMLLLSAFLMGSFGAAFGMEFFRHKTLNLKFRLLVPAAFLTNCLTIWFFVKEI